MEILSERIGDRERNALTIPNLQQTYTVKVDCEPVIKFFWNPEDKFWQYSPSQHFPFTYEVLYANEILVRITLDDNARTVHKPYVDDLSNPSIVYKLENAISEISKLPPPKCVDQIVVKKTDKKKKRKGIYRY